MDFGWRMKEILTKFPFKEEIEKITKYVSNEELIKLLASVLEKYIALDSELNLNFLAREMIEYIAATSEETKSEEAIAVAISCFNMQEIERVLRKYKKNKLNLSEIFSDIGALIHRKISTGEQGTEVVKRYSEWLENGFVSRFLNFVAEFPGNGMAPLQQNVFTILNVDPSKLEEFNQMALKLYRKKIPIEKKIELISLLSLLSSVNKLEYFEHLASGNIKKLKSLIENELKLPLPTKYSLECGIKFLKDVDKDPNLRFIHQKAVEFRGFGNWLRSDEITRSVIELMENEGFNSNLFLDSGERISQKKASESFSERWVEVFKHIVIKVLGSKRNELLPKISIPNHSPGSLYKKIKEDYKKALEEDKEAAKKVLSFFSTLIKNSYKNIKMPQSTLRLLQEIDALIYMMDKEIITNYQGSKIVGKVWRRKVPQDLYDVNKLWCCWFLPQNEDKEIPLIFIDPKTTLLQFYIKGIENPIAVAFLYAGKLENENCIFVDTWEGGPFTYLALSQEKMHEFVLKSLINFSRKVGAKRLLIYAHPKYTRAKEFGNFLRDKNFKIDNVFLEALDFEDRVLQKYSQTFQHHTTEAFGKNKIIKGNVEVFVFNC